MLRQSILSSRVATTLLLPGLFVFLWSTGFIGSKIVTQHAPPLTFLIIRFTLASIVLAPLIYGLQSKWPVRISDYLHSAFVGVLVHAVYLGGVFWAISLGTGAGISALIVGLQPLLTLCLAVIFLNEKAGIQKIAGLLLGLAGFAVIITERTSTETLDTTGLLLCTVSLLGISAGTIYQKRITTNIQLLPGLLIQYLGAALALIPAAIFLESFEINWNVEFVLATGWLVLVLSIGAILLLMLMIRSSEVSNVASLFYLVPPLTALEAFVLFGEALSPLSIGGMLLCVAGVAIVMHQSNGAK